MTFKRISLLALVLAVVIAGCATTQKVRDEIKESQRREALQQYQLSSDPIATGLGATAEALTMAMSPNGSVELVRRWVSSRDTSADRSVSERLQKLESSIESSVTQAGEITLLLRNNRTFSGREQAQSVLEDLDEHHAELSRLSKSIQNEVNYVYLAIRSTGGLQSLTFDSVESLKLDTIYDLARLNGDLSIAIRHLKDYVRLSAP